MSVVHRTALEGGALCKAGDDAFEHLKLSYYGFGVTCPDCKSEMAERRGDLERCPHCNTRVDAHRERCGACLRIKFPEEVNH